MEIGMSTFLPPCAAKRYSAAHLTALDHMLQHHNSKARWLADLAYEVSYLKSFYASVERFFFTPIGPGTVIDPEPFMLATYMSPNSISDVVASVADDIAARMSAKDCAETRRLRWAPIADGLLNTEGQLEAIRHEFMTLCTQTIIKTSNTQQ